MLAVLFGTLCLLFIAYISYIQWQLHSINRQLTKRLLEKTRQPLSLELINRQLSKLTAGINKCLAEEEKQRFDSIRREKSFKELIANISHDLRTPLTAIKGYQQLMEKEALTDSQLQKLRIAQKHANELGGLIEHFFEYSYLVNAEPDIKFEKINLTNLVTECLADSVNSFEENNLTVHLEDIPSAIIFADREMTTRIIQNLIRNCIEHSTGEIRVKLSKRKNAVVSFGNTVENAAAIDVKRLFDRFYTTDKSRHRSTGLGLSIVKLLAEQMGGSVSALLQEDMLEISVELPLYRDN